jgi:hypothetical protein
MGNCTAGSVSASERIQIDGRERVVPDHLSATYTPLRHRLDKSFAARRR